MKQYNELLQNIMSSGRLRENRTGVDTLNIFGTQTRYNLEEGFPLLTTRKMPIKSLIHELLWFLNGDTNVKYLQENNCKFWDEWALTEDQIVAHRPLTRHEMAVNIIGHMEMDVAEFTLEDGAIDLVRLHELLKPIVIDYELSGRKSTDEQVEDIDFCLQIYTVQNLLPFNTPADLKWFSDNHVVTSIIDLANTAVETGKVPDLATAESEISDMVWNITRGEIERQLEALPVDERPEITDELVAGNMHIVPEHVIVQQGAKHWDLTYSNWKPEVAVGDLGPVYGKVWTDWNGVDQIEELIENLKTRPFSRRHIVSAWNVDVLPDESVSPHQNVLNGRQSLAPCHVLFQMDVENVTAMEMYEMFKDSEYKFMLREMADHTKSMVQGQIHATDEFINVPEGRILKTYILEKGEVRGFPTKRLSCQLYQRSADMGIGACTNVASYALLTMMIAHVCGYAYGDFIHTIGNAHIYVNQINAIEEQLTREPRALPKMVIKRQVSDIKDFKIEDFELEGYDPHPAIKFPRPAV